LYNNKICQKDYNSAKTLYTNWYEEENTENKWKNLGKNGSTIS